MEIYKQEQTSTLIGKRDQNTTLQSDSSAVISRNKKPTSFSNGLKSKNAVHENQNLDLLFGATIFHFNQIFEDDLGHLPLDSNLEPSSDSSIGCISDRIVTATTGVFRTYVDLHPELSEENALEQFMNMVYQSIEIAFSDIKELLDSYNQLDEETTSALETLSEKIAEKNNDFINSFGFYCDELISDIDSSEPDNPSHYLWSHELHSH